MTDMPNPAKAGAKSAAGTRCSVTVKRNRARSPVQSLWQIAAVAVGLLMPCDLADHDHQPRCRGVSNRHFWDGLNVQLLEESWTKPVIRDIEEIQEGLDLGLCLRWWLPHWMPKSQNAGITQI